MDFWTAIFILAVLGIVTSFVRWIIKRGLRHAENIERIKHGYPTIEGDTPIAGAKEEPADGAAFGN